MKRLVLILFTLAALTTAGGLHNSSVAAPPYRNESIRPDKQVPAKAIEVYEYVLRTGKAPKGYVGGNVFHNREKRLPLNGNYREYDVNPKVNGKNRGPERIVIDVDRKSGWYTSDHYKTFVPIRK